MPDPVTQRVLEQYPSLAFLLNDPEIGPLLRDAVDPDKGFSAQTFQAKLYETAWWRTHSASARREIIERATDPQSAHERGWNYGAALDQVASQLGVHLNQAQKHWLTTLGIQQGFEPGSARMLQELARLANPTNIAKGRGTAGVAAHAASALASGRYFQEMSLQRSIEIGKAIATGKDTLESVEERLRVKAMSRFPHLADRLAAGESLAEIVDPYRQIVAEELELGSVGNVNMNDVTWRQLFGIRDPKTGKMRLPTESEVVRMARSRPQWWGTSRGRQMDAEATRGILQIMGVRR